MRRREAPGLGRPGRCRGRVMRGPRAIDPRRKWFPPDWRLKSRLRGDGKLGVGASNRFGVNRWHRSGDGQPGQIGCSSIRSNRALIQVAGESHGRAGVLSRKYVA